MPTHACVCVKVLCHVVSWQWSKFSLGVCRNINKDVIYVHRERIDTLAHTSLSCVDIVIQN